MNLLTIISVRLYGVAGAQAYVFMLNSERDTLWLKSLVVIVLYVSFLSEATNEARNNY